MDKIVALRVVGLGEKQRKQYACWLLQNRVTTSADRLAYYCGGKEESFKKFLNAYRRGECTSWRTGWQPTDAQKNALPVVVVPLTCCASGQHRLLFDMAGEEELVLRKTLPSALIDTLQLGEPLLKMQIRAHATNHFFFL
jgi:hypothetical protein